MLFGIDGVPIATLSLAVAVLAIATAGGITVPTLRAINIDPARSLRQE
jgi:hypothetical protein